MTINVPAQRPAVQDPLYEALGEKYAQDLMKLKRIKDVRNAEYEPSRPPGKKVFSRYPDEVVL